MSRHPHFTNQVEWWHDIFLQVIFVREAVYFVAFVIVLIAGGFFVAQWWEGAPSVTIAIAASLALQNYWRAARASRKLEKSFSEIDYESRDDDFP